MREGEAWADTGVRTGADQCSGQCDHSRKEGLSWFRQEGVEDTHLSPRPSGVSCVTSSDWSPCCVRGAPVPEGVPPVPWSLVWKPWPLAEGLLEGASAPCRNADPRGGVWTLPRLSLWPRGMATAHPTGSGVSPGRKQQSCPRTHLRKGTGESRRGWGGRHPRPGTPRALTLEPFNPPYGGCL